LSSINNDYAAADEVFHMVTPMKSILVVLELDKDILVVLTLEHSNV